MPRLELRRASRLTSALITFRPCARRQPPQILPSTLAMNRPARLGRHPLRNLATRPRSTIGRRTLKYVA
jgi:hypothetical protein